MRNIKLFKIKKEYIEFLRNHPKYGDLSLYNGDSENRPYFGPISIHGHNYYAPISYGVNKEGKERERIKYLTNKEMDYTPIFLNNKLISQKTY